jgi:hypothetical protein
MEKKEKTEEKIENTSKKIACIGWGSLIWDAQNLLIKREWFKDGPILPIEFARQSIGGRITLVITPEAEPVKTLWALMATDDLEEAKESLRIRENTTNENIKCVEKDTQSNDETEKLIIEWLAKTELDAAIWTNLPPKYENEEKTLAEEEVITYLKGLDINKQKLAEEYIRKTPKQIDTNYRRRIEKEFGWTYIDTKNN